MVVRVVVPDPISTARHGMRVPCPSCDSHAWMIFLPMNVVVSENENDVGMVATIQWSWRMGTRVVVVVAMPHCRNDHHHHHVPRRCYDSRRRILIIVVQSDRMLDVRHLSRIRFVPTSRRPSMPTRLVHPGHFCER